MARYKPLRKSLKLVPVDFDQQVIPGSTSATWLITNSTSPNSTPATRTTTKAPAFDPAALIKIILLAYSRGITSSREQYDSMTAYRRAQVTGATWFYTADWGGENVATIATAGE